MLQGAYERIIVKPMSAEKKINGIIINIKKPYEMGEVIALGSNLGLDINVGDFVYIHNNSGIEVEYEDQKYWSVHRQSILAFDKK